MSTPSGTGGGKPQAASTPQSHSHLNTFSSPAPRSVPSPATNRHTQAGKSPFNNNASAASHGTTATVTGGTRTVQPSPSSFPNWDSPAGMLPSLSNMSFADGGIGMALQGSGMNGGSSVGGKIDDQERRRRLEYMQETLRARPPKLSPEGVQIVAERLGLDTMMEPEQGTRKDGTRTCTIAGETIVVEVLFKANYNVESVEASSPGSNELVSQHFKSASEVLLRDVTEPPMMPLLRQLGSFSDNLERLAKMDKLNGPSAGQSFNCFEAIAGVYTSLKKLFEHEKQAVLALIDSNKNHREARAEREVMCKKSGRPCMNARSAVGMSLDYWMQKRFSYLDHEGPQNPDSMDVDSRPQTDPQSDLPTQKLFSLLIECEPYASELYTPVRISTEWISDKFEQPATEMFSGLLDWQHPPPTYLHSPGSLEANAMTLDQRDNKLPNIRFVAKLNPPLVLPSLVADNILLSTETQPDVNELQNQMIYHHLLLGINDPAEKDYYGGPSKVIQTERVTDRKLPNGSFERVTHRDLLTSKTPTASRTLREIPFYHPSQIVNALPILRQWACINSLLTQSFASILPEPKLNPEDYPLVGSVDVTFDASCSRFNIRFPTKDIFLEKTDILKKTNASLSDVLRSQSKKSQGDNSPRYFEATFDIGLNANFLIIQQHISTSPAGKATNEVGKNPQKSTDEIEKQRQLLLKLGKNFDVTSCLDMMAEYIKHSLSMPDSWIQALVDT
ncbi:hypothetical protein BT63DRAFT_450008 [Microthyrium microscopicum]|uniref:Mediator of RNA polymerase II transcription subunit 1 n=1 Tax=Microthyrium microscopicum TaxID=703497 RepID=A0A6A6US03_9PEZI|nr:hypothetical protein BT63DRAFT_450008 [Microthyrium microscopicum]